MPKLNIHVYIIDFLAVIWNSQSAKHSQKSLLVTNIHNWLVWLSLMTISCVYYLMFYRSHGIRIVKITLQRMFFFD